jgi:hypothetical protein
MGKKEKLEPIAFSPNREANVKYYKELMRDRLVFIFLNGFTKEDRITKQCVKEFVNTK